MALGLYVTSRADQIAYIIYDRWMIIAHLEKWEFLSKALLRCRQHNNDNRGQPTRLSDPKLRRACTTVSDN